MNTKSMRLMLVLAVLAAALAFGNTTPAAASPAPPGPLPGYCSHDGVNYAVGSIRSEPGQVNGEPVNRLYQCQQYVQHIDGTAAIGWRWVYIGYILVGVP
jgi:hypothetical protein